MEEKEILTRNGILNWSYYGDTFELANILIGNGFSINLCKRLSYKSLYDSFSKKSSPELTELFKLFGTSNFEMILENLQITKIINEAFQNDSTYINPIIEELKNGLISTIVATHPEYKEIDPSIFRSLGKEMSLFGNIYTTNYDVFLYKIILAYNELIDQKIENGLRYKDNFNEATGKDKLALNEFNDGSKDIYYLHGSLFLFHKNYTFKFKRGTSGDEYITLLRREIQFDNFPLFIAEGKYIDKLNSIQNNYYLRSCLENLKREKGPLVSYGFSFQESDKHIVDAINNSTIDPIIISIYPGKKTEVELKKETSKYNALFPNKTVSFYNSETLFHFHRFHKF